VRRIRTNAVRTAAHRVAAITCQQGARRFDRALRDCEGTQRAVLRKQLERVRGTRMAEALRLHPSMSPEAFRTAVSERTYADLARDVQAQRDGLEHVLTRELCERYQPTSGSSSKVKWIPYTRGFLDDLDEAVTPWVADLYSTAPRMGRGTHYWSLSWVPSSLRGHTSDNINDDRELLSWSKRLAAMLMAPVPSWVAFANTAEESAFATLCFLAAATDLSLMSVWSPTFALQLFETLSTERDAVAQSLEDGRWAKGTLAGNPPRAPRVAAKLRAWDGEVTPAFLRQLWPSLALVSSWDTSSSARWAQKLAGLLPHAAFQGKGLWATEGVVTIPYAGRYPLACRSHFYEFVDLQDAQVYFPWELQVGQEVRPLLTTGSGFLRYGLKDRLVVREHLGDTPCFEFLGRMGDVDMVGEKMSPELAEDALRSLEVEGRCRPVSLLPLSGGISAELGGKARPSYLALCEGPAVPADDAERGDRLDRHLRATFHYDLARDLGQLAPARVLTLPDARGLYEALGTDRGMVRGNIKIEPLSACIEGAAAHRLHAALGLATEPLPFTAALS